MSINVVMLSGNLTRDAEIRQTKNGIAVVAYGIAVNDRRKNPLTDEWEDYPNYINVTMFGNYGRSIADRLTKGTKVALHGSLRWSQWDKDGQKRSKLEVIADEVEFFSQAPKAETLFDDDCPF